MNVSQAISEYKIEPIKYPKNNFYDAIVMAVAHNKFKELPLKVINAFGKSNHVLFDIKHIYKLNEVDGRL